MAKSRLLLSDLLDQLNFALCIIRNDYVIVKSNEYFQSRAVYAGETMHGQNILELFPQSADYLKRKIDTALVIESSSFSSWEQKPHVLPFKSSRPVSGEETQMFQNLEVIPIHSEDGSIEHVCLCVYDVTIQASQQAQLKSISQQLEIEHQEQKALIKKLEETQGQLIQSEKMASIGQLSAGIAHEINNPVGFITSNIQTLNDYFQRLAQVIEEMKKMIDEAGDHALAEHCQEVLHQKQVNFILEDTSDLIQESLEGSSRVMSIVKNLKDFSHIDGSEWGYASLANGIESTLKIIHNEIKYNITVEKNYEDIPDVYCQPMQINQVLLNILLNASQAIEGEGKIYISLHHIDDNRVEIRIRDTGPGIPPAIRDRIFDPFFTTKAVGSGTGLGLSVSYGIINNHKGTIAVQSEIGVGSEFIITLPIDEVTSTDEAVEQATG
ncbi:ATP-binding protein [Vibrio mangrovi]|uniref:histidine kinase n=1 Tax=Vibrio mangrovi TaxID=474394 RepID=A0A1Y6IMD0_9VIBR|nr:ATP-binding protein [Vibrio mangrovi]MDW6004377.1 ATP-binding protein [Vibrio mangrovi]SMR98824.1 Sporulation kinase E [Vibrio mangrovi]